MTLFTPHLKHHILQQYEPRVRGRGFGALAQEYGVRGGKEVVRQWHRQWDGTLQSLESKPRSGRPRLLSSREVQQHIRKPILAANRAHKAVSYTQLLSSTQEKTGKKVSLRTLSRYGKEELGAKLTHGKKRTAEECECAHMRERKKVRVCVVQHLLKAVSLLCCFQCLPTCVSRSPQCVASFSASVHIASSF